MGTLQDNQNSVQELSNNVLNEELALNITAGEVAEKVVGKIAMQMPNANRAHDTMIILACMAIIVVRHNPLLLYIQEGEHWAPAS